MKLNQHLKNCIKKILPSTGVDFIAQSRKRKLANTVATTHNAELKRVKQKKTIRVVFLAIHDSVWKVDSVFRAMQADPFFEPIILVCPYIIHGHDRMLDDMDRAYDFFSKKGYPVTCSYDHKNERWIRLEDLKPDIIFFTNPHNLTISEYYTDAFMNYLSCYVPYAYEVSHYDNNQAQYNQNFHNAMWLIFAPHSCSKDTYESTSAIKGRNVVITGYPGCEDLIDNTPDNTVSVWKPQDKTKLKIIWAPHHTIDSSALPYSNFLNYAGKFKELAIARNETTQWSFKPHPLLKSRLYGHKDWGIEKTDEYYRFWASQPNTQLDLGPYANLFKQSDVMIHDSGSFLAEYLFMGKPVLYLIATQNYLEFYNAFGTEALQASRIATRWEDVVRFVDGAIHAELPLKPAHQQFINRYARQTAGLPSARIVHEIKSRLSDNRS